MAGEAQATGDGCLTYVEERLKSSLKLKDDVWQRFLDSEYRCASWASSGWQPGGEQEEQRTVARMLTDGRWLLRMQGGAY